MNIYILMFFMSKTFDPNIPIDFRMNWMWTNMIQSFRQYIEISFWHQSESYAISLQRFKFARFYCLCLLLKGSKQIRLEPIKECLTIGDTGKKATTPLWFFTKTHIVGCVMKACRGLDHSVHSLKCVKVACMRQFEIWICIYLELQMKGFMYSPMTPIQYCIL